MATLSGTKKKQKRNLTIMIVAIIVVLLALAFVIFDKLSTKTFFDGNLSLNAIQLSGTKYIGVFYDSESETCNVTYGTSKLVDYLDNFETDPDAYADFDPAKEAKNVSYTLALPENIKAQKEAADAAKAERDAAVEAANAIEDEDEKAAALEAANAIEIPAVDEYVPVIDDILKFKGAEYVELSGVTVSDPAKYAEFTKLTAGSFYNCGLTSVDCFAGIANEKLKSLTIIVDDKDAIDWSPLSAVADKVILDSYSALEPTEDGSSYQIVPVTLTLTDYLAQKNEANTETDTDAGDDAVIIEEGSEDDTNDTDESEENTEADNGEENAETGAGEEADESDAGEETDESTPAEEETSEN